jgi:tetratricopeptide (TPR) repeat protein
VPTIVIRHPDGTTEEREVTGRLTVGADEENDLVLRAGGVSQRHAQFFADGGEVVLENVGSAAATIVDGETISSPRKLKQGVRVLIGEYEVSLKPDRVSVRKLAAVPASIAANTLPDDGGPVGRPPAASGGTGWLIGIGAVVIVAVLGILGMALFPGKPTVIEIPNDPPPVAQPCADLEPQLRIAREEPSERSLAAANAVLECDPLGAEILALKRSIEKELKGAAAAERGTKMVDLGRDEQAFEAFREIPEGTRAFISLRPQALEVTGRIRKENTKACLAYAREGKWVQAQPVCEKAMEIACQGMMPDALFKPRDPVLLHLIKSREVNDPSGPKWKCAAIPLIKPAEAAEDPAKAIHEAIAKRINDPQIAAAVAMYVAGKINEAIVQLQVVKEKSSKAAVHAQAESLRKDMANVDSLKKIADGMLNKGELEKASKTYREALEIDARVVPELDRQPSASRRSMQQEMANAALRIGVPLRNRPDMPRACAAFRLGFSFSKGNTDLNAAVTDCSEKAKALLTSAKSCAELDRALVLAMPGDGIAEDIGAQKPQLNCR